MQTPSHASLRAFTACLLSVFLFVSAFLSSASIPTVAAASFDTAGYTSLLVYHSARHVSVTPNSRGLVYRPGYSRQVTSSGVWLCYGWPNGVYRCTQRWHRNGVHGRLISDHPAWVPNGLPSAADVQPMPVPRADPPTTQPPGYPPGWFPPKGVNTALQPCHDAIVWPARITAWTAPSGCYGRIFYPSMRNYAARPSYGWCNWWPEVLHPGYGGSTVLHLASHNRPIPGAVVFFSGGIQGASWAGHYAQVVAISPGGYWLLITEMNFAYRGGGWGRVDYRFVHVGYGVSFRYA